MIQIEGTSGDVWFIDAMRVARREQRYSMPIAATFVFMAHDSAYVGHFSSLVELVLFGLLGWQVFGPPLHR